VSQPVTSCAPHPKPATKLLDSHYSSDRGACGFVLTGNTEVSGSRVEMRIADNTSAGRSMSELACYQ
jgi:hypothetical protein